MFLPHNEEHPPHAEMGYVYDNIRQQQNQQVENKLSARKFKKKIDKLTRKNKILKPK